MRFYCGVSERVWNHHPVNPGPYACISPVSGRTERTRKENWVKVPQGTVVIQDSGAFSDGPGNRLSLSAALERQQQHSEKHNYIPSHRASYDLLIDETWIEGQRRKQRWSWLEAEDAVDTTVRAAEYMAKHRDTSGVILSAQGVTPTQYLGCAVRVMEYMDPATDILGLGGWCIVGIHRSLLPTFEDTMALVVPAAAQRGVKRVHVWGVIFADAVGKLLWLCDKHGIELSTDSVGPNLRPAMNRWGYANWIDPDYQKPGPETLGVDRARHVQAVREWLARLSTTQYYMPPRFVHPKVYANGVVQTAMFTEEVA